MGRCHRRALSAKDVSDLQLRSRHPGARLLQTSLDGLILQIRQHLVGAHSDNSPATRYSLLAAIFELTGKYRISSYYIQKDKNYALLFFYELFVLYSSD